MNTCKTISIAVFFMIFVVIGPPEAGADDPEQTSQLTLIITSATSGKLFDSDGTTIASLVATVREATDRARGQGRSVVVLDAGRTVLPYAESRFDRGTAMADVLEMAGCSVFAPAPIDFSIGLDRLAEMAEQGSFKVLRSFSAPFAEGADALAEKVEIELDGGPVLEVISLMNPSYAGDLASTGVLEGTALAPPKEPAGPERIRVSVLHSRGHANELTGRAMTWDLVSNPGGLNVLIDPDLGVDAIMRSVSSGHPVVLVGRDQDRNPPWTAARVDLDLEHDGARWRVTSADMEVLGIDLDAPVNPALFAKLRAAQERFRTAQARPFGEHAPGSAEQLEAYVLEALRERARAEVAILSRGALRPISPEHFPDGRTTRETVSRLLTFDQYVVVGQLTGEDIEGLVKESVRRVRADGSYLMGSLVFAGVTFSVSNEGTADATASDIRVNGRPIRGDDLYSVATNDFLAAGGDGYPVLAAMDGDWLTGGHGGLVELRSGIVVPRLESSTRDFVDLEGRPLWRWGLDRASLAFNNVTTSRDPGYDDVSDSRARADDSTAILTELRGFVDREQPDWSWENLLWARYGVLDIEGADEKVTDDIVRFETSAVLTRASILGGGHPYSSVDVVTEIRPATEADGTSAPRRLEQSLAAGIDWSAASWPKLRLGLAGRHYSHVDRDPQIGLVGEAIFERTAKGPWPAMDARFFAEHLINDDGSISRFDLDLRLLFDLYRDLKLTPAVNYYVYQDSELDGTATYLRFSLGLSYAFSGKHQSW